MSVAAIQSPHLSDPNASTLSRIPVQTLGQDDFLKLLITQLTTQDPLSPKQDSDFIAQMATFSSLEHAKSMQSDMAQLRADQQVLNANSLLGRTVELVSNDSSRTIGLVSAVQLEAGKPKLVVDGVSYDLSQVITIAPTPIILN